MQSVILGRGFSARAGGGQIMLLSYEDALTAGVFLGWESFAGERVYAPEYPTDQVILAVYEVSGEIYLYTSDTHEQIEA